MKTLILLTFAVGSLSACGAAPQRPSNDGSGSSTVAAKGDETKGDDANAVQPEPPVIGGNDASAEGVAACQAIGGVCSAISSCSKGAGLLGLISGRCDTRAPQIVCCLPIAACGGEPEFSCCSETAEFRPLCDGGDKLQCAPGQTRC